MPEANAPRVAVIHDWLNGMRGGERVLEAILELFPGADLFTLFYEPEKISPLIRNRRVRASFLNRFAVFRRFYRHLLPFFPTAIARFDLRGYDLILSSSHCVAKGVRKSPAAVHVSYIHAPMRYMWSRFEDYFGRDKASFWVRGIAKMIRPFLQAWDRRVSQPDRVDRLVANSRFIAEQIREFYGREADVVHPFAELKRFDRPRQVATGSDRFYLVVSAFAPNKRVDLAIEACTRLGVTLKLVGGGQEAEVLRGRIASSQVQFLGILPDEEIAELYSRCEAFLFPGVEDFGITPLEAMAAGAPVIAYQMGGACETVTEETGVFFREQSAEGLMEAIRRFESQRGRFEAQACRERAQAFTRAKFQREFFRIVQEAWKKTGRSELTRSKSS